MEYIMKKPTQNDNYKIHPLRFNLWLFIICVVMLFAAFTSAYIVRRGELRWLNFEMPQMFTVSSVLIVLSSLSMWWAYASAKKDELGNVKAGLITTLFLGIAFCVSQFLGWREMVAQGLYFRNAIPEEISASFLYVITWAHVLHLLGGLIWLIIMIAKAVRLQVHKKNMLSIGLASTYWHFLGLLWIYLFLFLYFTR
jgi:cytochrome c oxidase subunit III